MFFNNYSKPGKGVNKRDPNQPRIQVFFDILSRKIWSLIKLNILYVLSSIPFFIITMLVMGVVSETTNEIVSLQLDNVGQLKFDIIFRAVLSFLFTIFIGQGPVTAGYIYIIKEYGREHHCWLVNDFFEKCKDNFKQAILLWIVDLIIFSLLVVAFNVYAQLNMIIFQCIIVMIAMMYILLHIYVYQMMISFDLTFKKILKNSFLLGIGKAPANLIILILNIFIYILVPFSIILTAKSVIALLLLFIMEVLILPSITSFAINFYIYPTLEKYINIANKS